MKKISEFEKQLQEIYLKHFQKDNPFLFFEDSPETGVIYLSKDMLDKKIPDSDGIVHKIVPFSKSHKISCTITKKIITMYGIKEVKIIENGVINDIKKIDVPYFIEDNSSDPLEKSKYEIDNYINYDTRRILFLLKRTKKVKYFDILKKGNFIVPCKIEKTKIIPLVLKKKTKIYKNSEDSMIETERSFAFVFSDSYAYENFVENAIKKADLEFNPEQYNLLLMPYSDIKKALKTISVSGICINEFDQGIFHKSTSYLAQ